MLFSSDPSIRSYDHVPDKRALAEPLDHPGVHMARLRFEETSDVVTARWVVPWGWLLFSFGIGMGGVTAGIVVGYSMDRIDRTSMLLMLGLQWLLIVPTLVWILRRVLRPALRQPVHIVLDKNERVARVAGAEGNYEECTFDQVQAFVNVSRMIQIGSGADSGRRWVRRSEFSLLLARDGTYTQIPLYAIQDQGQREEELRRWTHEIPRLLGCDRIGVALNKEGELRGRRDLSDS